MVAIGGDSGTGKSTLRRGIEAVFGPERCAGVSLDDYHALDRAQRRSVGLTALDPRANNFAAMEEDLWQLAHGRPITKPVYDHASGTFAAGESVAPVEIVVVEGLVPLYTRALRAMFDVSVWLEPQTELTIAWKLQRDTAERGYSEAEVREEIEKRRPDAETHIAPQRVHADLCVRFSRRPGTTDNALLDAHITKGGRFPPLDYRHFASRSTHLRQIEGGRGPYPHTLIELDGDVDDATARAVQERIRATMAARDHGLRRGRLGIFDDGKGPRVSHTLALAQLLIARRICLVLDQLSDGLAA